MTFAYFFRRILLMLPTIFGITLVSFVIINLAPGSPIEQKLQAMRFGESSSGTGVSEHVVEQLRKQYGFDKPLMERYWIWLKNIAALDFGKSFKYEEPVTDLIIQRFPVSLTFGIISFLLAYLISVPLGVAKAVFRGSAFDMITSLFLFFSYALPSLILGILLLVFFASPTYLGWFPLSGIQSENFHSLGFFAQIWDRVHHAVLPVIAYIFGAFSQLTILMQNSMLEVINADYVRTARAKGLSQTVVYMRHALRNALIPIATSMSGIFTVFFAGSIIVEGIFSLDGMGLLTITAVNARDYNVLMGLIFFQALLFMLGRLFTDFLYVIVDPRIEFQ